MPDYHQYPLMLAGPILRRGESRSVSVWDTLSRPARVSISIWQGVVDTGTDEDIFTTPGKREIGQDKCLGANFKILMLKVLSVFLFFMTGFLEQGTNKAAIQHSSKIDYAPRIGKNLDFTLVTLKIAEASPPLLPRRLSKNALSESTLTCPKLLVIFKKTKR
ncbi:MAG: hypothetical protein GY799_07430 [Desulfobulbaceae bacterium]|nr:hypothetical protein [Desulfobulbaceae bacterium]